MKSYVINLDRRPDKWKYSLSEFAKMGIDIIRFPAFPTKPGWMGCRDSHIAVMEKGEYENCISIYEDDVKFLYPPIEFNNHLLDSTWELPDDWDFLSLGASPQEPMDKYSDNLVHLNGTAWCLHAYIINNSNGLIDFVLENRANIGKIDKWFSENVYINPRFKCFMTYPILATQFQFDSDTCGRSDVSTIVKQYNKFVNVQ